MPSPPLIKPKASIWLRSNTSIWRNMDDVRAACAGKPVKISGLTLDLMDCQLVGTKLPQPKNDQDENSVPLRINIDGFTLRNGSTRSIPGGILFRGKGLTFADLIFLDVGEDAISNVMDDSPDATVIGCEAWGASDKSYQFNDARGLTFAGNLAVGGITGVRIQKKATKFKNIKTRRIQNNRFINCDTAWNLSGGVTVIARGTKYTGVKTRWVQNTGASHQEL